MGFHDTTAAPFSPEDSYETRELAWELQQAHPDQQRVRLLIDHAADVSRALDLSHIGRDALRRNPRLRGLNLLRYLPEETQPPARPL